MCATGVACAGRVVHTVRMGTTRKTTTGPTEGITRCACGSKYWDGNTCHSCGAPYAPTSYMGDAADVASVHDSPAWVAWDRTEDDSCQRSTTGCCVDHSAAGAPDSCETW
jgi:hypothetical protein